MLGDDVLDLPPEVSKNVLGLARIDPDYFGAVPRDPNERELTRARQTLARLLGYAVPDDDGLYPALDDLFHGLEIGPCSPEQIAAFADHPWVQVVGQIDAGWDCDYETWLADFRDAIPDEPFTLKEATDDAPEEGELPDGVHVERDGKKWVVRDRERRYWCGLVENGWTGAPDEMPALSFATEDEARSAYLRADRMYGERADRHAEAFERLGIEEE